MSRFVFGARGVRQISIVRAKRRAVRGDGFNRSLLAGESGQDLSDGVAGQLLGSGVVCQGRRQIPRGWALQTA